MAFTIFYDGNCPLCVKEINLLKKRNAEGKLEFEDIYKSDFRMKFPDLDWHSLNERIHAIDEYGKVYRGLDVTHKAWSLVGVGWLYAPLRWPIIRLVADAGYKIFARHRYRISYLLTGKKRTDVYGQSPCERKLR
ncbi:MAG: DUF393 domain-containing protein [Pseudomonadota bacterium]